MAAAAAPRRRERRTLELHTCEGQCAGPPPTPPLQGGSKRVGTPAHSLPPLQRGGRGGLLWLTHAYRLEGQKNAVRSEQCERPEMRIAGRDGHGDVRCQEPGAPPLQVGEQQVAQEQSTQEQQRVAPSRRAVVLDRIDENQQEGGQYRGLGPHPFAPPTVEHPGKQEPGQQGGDAGGSGDRKRQEANRVMAQDSI